MSRYLTIKQVQRAKELYEAGYGCTRIGALIDPANPWHKTTIQKALKKQDVKLRSQNDPVYDGQDKVPAKQKELMVRLYLEWELSSIEIAQILDKSPSAIRNNLRRAGVMRPVAEALRLAYYKRTAKLSTG